MGGGQGGWQRVGTLILGLKGLMWGGEVGRWWGGGLHGILRSPPAPGTSQGLSEPRVGQGSQCLGGFIGEILPIALCPLLAPTPRERPHFSAPGRGSAAAAQAAPCGVRSS